jgi:cysteine-rich repeat protein
MARPIQLLAVLLLSSAGCRVFDESLYKSQDAGNDQPDAAAETDGEPSLTLGERCSSAPEVRSSGTPLAINTMNLASDFKDLSACTGAEQPGNDGFVSVQMNAGEKWHVHVATTDPKANPALYILPASCDERACVRGVGTDECGAGKPEHLSFFAPTTGRYVVGVDSSLPGGATYTIIVIRPTCGNGVVEHSETCDDSNTIPGDGCDPVCRKELGVGARELEPNDDYLAANVVAPGASVTATGTLNTRCDQDMFAVEVPETAGGASLAAELLTPGGATCPTRGPDLKLTLVRPDGQTEIGAVQLEENQGCPVIDPEKSSFAKGLPKGVYFVRVNTTSQAMFDYQIKLTRR